MKAAVLLLAGAATAALAAAQPATTTATTTVTGRVVAAQNGEPIVNARVAAPSTSPIGTPVTLTDDKGSFTLTVASDSTRVVASKSGFGRQEVARAGRTSGIELRLTRGAAISGRVVDETGEPIESARVMLHTVETVRNAPPRPGPLPSGIRPMGPLGEASGTAETDDRGEYRLAGVPPGVYYASVIAIGPNATIRLGPNQVGYAPAPIRLFYPNNAEAADAEQVRLEAGQDLSGIDFVVTGARTSSPAFGMFEPGPFTRPPTASPGAPSGIIRGRVVGSDGGRLANAAIRLALQAPGLQTAFSRADRDGRYEFRNLPAGKYELMAAKVGYGEVAGTTTRGLLNRPTLVVTLGEGETRENTDVTLARWGSISGRVADERGDPIQGASVQLMQVRYEAGRRSLVQVRSARLTDDLGRYRLFTVAPGRYIVSAAVGDVQSADLPGYARGFYPNTSNPAQAVFVSVAVQQDIMGIDVGLARTRTARIAGQLLDSAGQPTLGGSLSLTPSQRSASVTSVQVGARIMPDGKFEFANVPPGQYIIRSYRGRSKGWIEGEFGTLPVSVDGTDVTDLVLQTSRGSSIHGQFTFDSRDPTNRPKARDIDFSPTPVDFDLAPPSVASAEIHDDWSFDVEGVNGPRRLQLVRAPAGWTLEDVRVHGISAADQPLPFGKADQSLDDVEVVLTDRVSQLTGVVTNDRREPAAGASVIVFSTDRSRWYPTSRFLRMSATGGDGAYSLSGLPFGAYYAAAVARLPNEGDDAWQDQEYLNSLLLRATSITVHDDQTQSIDLRLVTPR